MLLRKHHAGRLRRNPGLAHMHTSPILEASLWVLHQLGPSQGASLLLSHPLPAPVPNSLFCLLLPHFSLPPSPQNPHALFLNLSRSLHCFTLLLPLGLSGCLPEVSSEKQVQQSGGQSTTSFAEPWKCGLALRQQGLRPSRGAVLQRLERPWRCRQGVQAQLVSPRQGRL